MTHAERVAYVANLERQVAADNAKHEAARARYEAIECQLNMAMRIYIDTVTAPMRALAEELRERKP